MAALGWSEELLIGQKGFKLTDAQGEQKHGAHVKERLYQSFTPEHAQFFGGETHRQHMVRCLS